MFCYLYNIITNIRYFHEYKKYLYKKFFYIFNNVLNETLKKNVPLLYDFPNIFKQTAIPNSIEP